MKFKFDKEKAKEFAKDYWLAFLTGAVALGGAVTLSVFATQKSDHTIAITELTKQKEDKYIVLFYSSSNSECRTMSNNIRKLEKNGIGWYLCDISSFNSSALSAYRLTESAQYNVYATSSVDIGGKTVTSKYVLYQSYGVRSADDLLGEIEYIADYGKPDGAGSYYKKTVSVDDADGGSQTITAYCSAPSSEAASSGGEDIAMTFYLASTIDVTFRPSSFSFEDADHAGEKLDFDAEAVSFSAIDDDGNANTNPVSMVFSIHSPYKTVSLKSFYAPGGKTVDAAYATETKDSQTVYLQTPSFGSSSWKEAADGKDAVSSPEINDQYLVSFDLSYGGRPDPSLCNGLVEKVKAGASAEKPTLLQGQPLDNHYIKAWHLSKDLSDAAYDLSSKVNAPMTLYAEWAEGDEEETKAPSAGVCVEADEKGKAIGEADDLRGVKLQYRLDGKADSDGHEVWTDWSPSDPVKYSGFDKTMSVRTVASSKDGTVEVQRRSLEVTLTKKHVEQQTLTWQFKA
jgi:hypothetical protein